MDGGRTHEAKVKHVGGSEGRSTMVEKDKISPCLWFDNQAEEAANFYVSVFREARILNISRISAGPAEGNALVELELFGHKFTAFDGGPLFKFTPAISFVVKCESQEEIDYYWEKLAADGSTSQCGWLEDRFGISWQVAPAILPDLMERNAERVMEALLSMTKPDIEQLRRAAGYG